MSTTSVPTGYQLGNTYDWPELTGSNYTSYGIIVQRVDDDDDTVMCYVSESHTITGNAAFTATATVDPSSAPTGYHYVYGFWAFNDTDPQVSSPSDSGACVSDSTHIRFTYPSIVSTDAMNASVDVLQQQNDGSFVSIGTITGTATLAFDPTQLQIFRFVATRTSDSTLWYSEPSLITTACPTARKGSGGGFWALMR